MSARTTVAAAVTPWTRERLSRPSRPAEVVHRGPHAVYLHDGTDVLAVVAAGAVRVPCAAQTTLTSLTQLTADAVTVEVGDGRMAFPGGDVRAGRVVDQHVPRLGAEAIAGARERLGDAVPTAVRAELPADGLAALAEADPSAPSTLVGLGSGLTPLGDDVLCGWLATMTAVGQERPDPVRAAIDEPLLARTTALSATLLRCALEGQVLPEFARLVEQLSTRGGDPGAAVGTLLRIGHTSGAGLVLGLTLALDHLASDHLVTRSCP